MKKKGSSTLFIFLCVLVFLAFLDENGVGEFFSDEYTELFTGQVFDILKFLFFPIIIGTKIINGIHKIKNIKRYDLEKNPQYYKDILQIDSPLIIGFLNDFEINNNKLIAALLELKSKGAICFENEKIEKNSDFDKNELSKSNRYIFEKIIGGKLMDESKSTFSTILSSDIAAEANMKYGLITNKKRGFSKVIIEAAIIILLLIFVFIMDVEDNINMTMLGFAAIVLCLGAFKKNHGYKRTEKGKELNKKIEGLKVIFKRYDWLKIKSLNLFEMSEDEYLIYSVLLGQNKDIIDEYEKYIDLNDEK